MDECGGAGAGKGRGAPCCREPRNTAPYARFGALPASPSEPRSPGLDGIRQRKFYLPADRPDDPYPRRTTPRSHISPSQAEPRVCDPSPRAPGGHPPERQNAQVAARRAERRRDGVSWPKIRARRGSVGASVLPLRLCGRRRHGDRPPQRAGPADRRRHGENREPKAPASKHLSHPPVGSLERCIRRSASLTRDASGRAAAVRLALAATTSSRATPAARRSWATSSGRWRTSSAPWRT